VKIAKPHHWYGRSYSLVKTAVFVNTGKWIRRVVVHVFSNLEAEWWKKDHHQQSQTLFYPKKL
jgi:hypothetical protein